MLGQFRYYSTYSESLPLFQATLWYWHVSRNAKHRERYKKLHVNLETKGLEIKRKKCGDGWDAHIHAESQITALQPPLITFVRIPYPSAPLLSCSTAVPKLNPLVNISKHILPYTCSNSSSLNLLIIPNSPFNCSSSSPHFTKSLVWLAPKSFNSRSLNISNNTLT